MELIQTDQWETPDDLFDVLNDEFNFEVDLCANENRHKLQLYTDDIEMAYRAGYLRNNHSFWMNPPYSRNNIDYCMQIAVGILQEDLANSLVTLTRFDPTTDWFQTYIDGVADEVRMLARRVKFIGAKDSYNFPCCVSVYRDGSILPKDTDYYIWDWKE